MKILITSLQVSTGASKGHLHPAIEIGIELKHRGHEVAILPLPSQFNKADRIQVEKCDLAIIDPPDLPTELLVSPQKLSEYAKHASTTHLAYHAFLVAPLDHQFHRVLEKIRHYNPAVIVYDLLVYAAPIAARLLNIPDIGYCAGLKLIAPNTLTIIYQTAAQKLVYDINQFLTKYKVKAQFHHLELLSSSYQCVFTPPSFIQIADLPPRTVLAGSLPVSPRRYENTDFQFRSDYPFIILCFGSVCDPTHFPVITNLIIKIVLQLNYHLLISTQHPELIPRNKNITTAPYLPLPQLLPQASLLIHHGGANTFSECLTLGIPQLLIPLVTDQPIQAEFLRSSQAGIALYTEEVTEQNLKFSFQQLLNKTHSIHQRIHEIKQIFQQSNGAATMGDLIEATT